MKLLKTILATAAIAGFASTAAAQDTGFYGTAGADLLTGGGVDLVAVTGRLGYNFTEYNGFKLGVEGQAATGLAGDSGVSLDSQFAGFGIVSYPVTEQLDLFGRVGYHTTDVGESFDGVAFGGGGQWNFTGVDGIRLDYTFLDVSGGNADEFSVAYVRKF